MKRLRRLWPALPPIPEQMPGSEPYYAALARMQARLDRAEAHERRLCTLVVIWAALIANELIRVLT